MRIFNLKNTNINYNSLKFSGTYVFKVLYERLYDVLTHMLLVKGQVLSQEHIIF